jgi:hypothetical protein
VLDAAASEAVVASVSLALDSGGADGLALGSGSNQGYYSGSLNLGSGQVQTFYASTSYHRVKGSRTTITGAGCAFHGFRPPRIPQLTLTRASMWACSGPGRARAGGDGVQAVCAAMVGVMPRMRGGSGSERALSIDA